MPGPDQQPQNIYDDAAFFAGYSTLDRFGPGWQRAMELGDFLGLLPPVAGARVLDLGCGAGQLAGFLAEQGAASVLGVDVSARMLAQAEPHPRLRLERAAIEDLTCEPASFELVVSSLAFHYVADYAGLIRRIAGWLTPGGVLVFSTEHPIYTARLPDLGWITDAAGHRSGWAIDHYGDEGPRQEHWFVEGVRKEHRTISTLVNGILDAGLRLERLIEPLPSPERLRARPDDADERRRPMFVLIRASRPAPA
jgi:SAM-dependent methyltransferase